MFSCYYSSKYVKTIFFFQVTSSWNQCKVFVLYIYSFIKLKHQENRMRNVQIPVMYHNKTMGSAFGIHHHV